MILIKIGGTVIENLDNLLADIPEDVIIVHGGGKEVTRIAEKLGKKQQFIVSPSGYRSRYTDQETMEIFQMVIAGRINKDIVRKLMKLGRRAVGICGVDMELIKAERKKSLIAIEGGRKRIIEGGYTGKIVEINKEFLHMFLDNNIIPVIGAVAISEEFEPLNVDADRIVGAISQVVGVDKIIFFTDQNGILDKNSKTISRVKRSQLENLEVGFGMDKKLLGSSEAKAGEIIIANGLVKRPFSNIQGTVIVNE